MAAPQLVLLAMDNPALTGLLERALSAAHYAVAVAGDGPGLDKALNETSPLVVLISERFAGSDGLALAESMLQRFPTLPVLLYADKKELKLLQRALRSGLSDCLFPPLKVDEIVSAVRNSEARANKTGDWVRKEIKRTTASLEKRVDVLETMLALGRTITASLDLDEVLTRVVSTAVQLTRADRGVLWLVAAGERRVYQGASIGLPAGAADSLELDAAGSLVGRVVATQEPFVFADSEPYTITPGYTATALIYVPLRVREQVIGVLGVDNSRPKGRFNEQDRLLMSILAEHTTIAIENARLYSKVDQERDKFETTFANIADGVVVLDESREHLLLINPAARQFFGLGLGELTGRPVKEVIQHADFDLLVATLIEQAALEEHEIRFDDGRVYLAAYALVTDVGWVITMQDVTNLKMLDRVRSEFIHTVSHDLRSPLTAILGYVELLGRVGPLNDTQLEFIRRSQSSIHQITALVNDLLDLGRIEAGIDTGKENVGLGHILRYTMDNLHRQIEDKQLELVLDVPAELPPVRGNPMRLRQLFDNLIGNAVKYTPVRGRVSIRIEAEKEQNIITIKDTGLGIPTADLPHVFEKFYRGSNAPRQTPGTGLGLAIVKTIVESHQGRVWVESTVGQGTSFYVVLPCYSADRGSQSGP